MSETPYVLGTHDEEIARLKLQHRVWRARALEAWTRAGLGPGQTILDLGCGPGFAALDLARLVGPTGRVIAIDRSRRFLDELERAARELAITHIDAVEGDLDAHDLPVSSVDGVWCRWAIAFVRRPRDLMSRVYRALRPGGAFVAHEYFDYGTWRMAPPLAELDEFVRLVMESWRDAGGEPDIGLELPAWLEQLGATVTDARPIVEIIDPASPMWPWPRAFVQSGLGRLVELGHLGQSRADEIWNAFDARERAPHARMITPGVLEVIGRRASTDSHGVLPPARRP